MLLENFGMPVIRGETVLIAAAVYAGTGRAQRRRGRGDRVVAAVVGAKIGYFIGRFGGRALVLRLGKYVF